MTSDTSNIEPRINTDAPPPRCPLCNHPLTRLQDFAACTDCNVFTAAPYTEWHPFDSDKEN